MSYIKYLRLVLLFFSILSCADNVSSQNQIVETKKTIVVENNFEINQYAVYDALIEKLIKDEILFFQDSKKTPSFIIINKTDIDYRDNPTLNTVLNNIKTNLPSLSDEIIKDFLNKNKERVPIKDSFNIKTNRVFITDEEFKNILGENLDWKAFFEKYPNSQGVMTLSNIGFDKEMKKAFVYVENSKGSMDGVGMYIILEKNQNNWKVKEKTFGWMS